MTKGRGLERCRARETAIDGSCPVNAQCLRKSGHAPPHHCPHGFHWTDKHEDFKGVCGHCGQNVILTAVTPKKMSEKERKKRPCAACGKSVGTATLVAGGPFPDAPLCLGCWDTLDVEETYDAIRKRRAGGVT